MKELLKDPASVLIALSMVSVSTNLSNATLTALLYTAASVVIFLKDGINPFRGRSMSLYIGFVLIVLIYSAFGKGTLSGVTFNTKFFSFVVMFSAFMMSYHVKTLNSKQIKVLLGVAYIALFYTIIGTTLVSFIDPMAVRTYGFGNVDEVDLNIASRYRSMGMMSYRLAHGMSVLAVALSVLILRAKSKWIKVVSAVMLLLLMRLLFVMTITTALFLATIGITVVFAHYFSKGRTFVAIALTVLIVAVFFLSGLSDMFLDFSGGANDEIYRKFSAAFSYAETGSDEGQMGFRLQLYEASLRTFLSNPLFGWGSDNGSHLIIGDHSYLLDYLAYFGLFSLLLFVAWWKEYKYMSQYLTKNLRSYYFYCFIPVVGLVAMKGASVCGALPFMSLVLIQVVFRFLTEDDKSVSAANRKTELANPRFKHNH